ncbi:uncharacterized protein [Dermacentor albipictus]|uniref:uncharacterized protein isoform X8 n=1 Tax=Dermacentor albipictus TaxID=60249 RepID=UPI0038FBFDF0
MHFQPCFSKADQKHQKVSADTDVPFSCCRLTSGISCASRDRHRRRHMALDVLPLAVSVHGGAYRVSYLPAEPPTWQRAGTSLLPCAEDISPHRRRHFTAFRCREECTGYILKPHPRASRQTGGAHQIGSFTCIVIGEIYPWKPTWKPKPGPPDPPPCQALG